MSWIFLNKLPTCWTFGWYAFWVLYKFLYEYCRVMLCKSGLCRRAASICLYHCLSRWYYVETNHHSGFSIPNLMETCRRAPPALTGRRLQVKYGNSSPSGSGWSGEPGRQTHFGAIQSQTVKSLMSFTKLQEDENATYLWSFPEHCRTLLLTEYVLKYRHNFV